MKNIKGFSLVEITIALAAILILFGTIIYTTGSFGDSTKRIEMKIKKKAMEGYIRQIL